MRNLLIFLLIIGGRCFSGVQAQNIEGQIIASEYGQWKVSGYAPDTFVFSPTACRVQGGDSFFPAFSVGTSVLIVDGNPALNEIVTPTSVDANNVTCSITINPIYHHNLPFYITSATGGLQEAINANVASPSANTVVLNSTWHQLTRSDTVISSILGTAQLGLVDITTLPSNWYRWNGVQYVLVPFPSSLTSVFGRTGDVVAEGGDYNCSQVTNCPTVVVDSFNGRSAAVQPQAGDYDCGMVTGCPTGAFVNSFNDRTGVVVPQTADYTCSMVTGCAPGGPVDGWAGTLTSIQASGDTTAFVTSVTVAPSASSYFWVGTEWEEYSGVTTLGGGSYELLNVLRGKFNTAAVPHSSGSNIISISQALGPDDATMFGSTSTAITGKFFSVGCAFPSSVNATIFLEVGCGGSNSFYVETDGSFASSSSGTSHIAGSGGLSINTNNLVGSYNDVLNNVYALKATAQIPQTVLPTQFDKDIGFGSGISGVRSVIAPTAAAPLLQNDFVPSGSTTNTYLCQGTDGLGNNIPGTSASLTNLAASAWGVGAVNIYCPLIPGAVTTIIYRTAGGPNQGIIHTVNSGQSTFQDQYTSATAGSPNATNTTIGAVCTNGTQFCILSGATSTPPTACVTATEGWEFHDVQPLPAHHAYICESGTWTGVY